ncbi:MAG: trehalose-phosphatase [Candidatus Omnitrophica bacterium CG11_big_fil_rev_8_21_14_0_20_64_10]|nr:MAG: trehalose-phosphatase [Candidatus Omnitrophica bacterium CG11_big_fil_rev_8_21_14_0_20_64_10]
MTLPVSLWSDWSSLRGRVLRARRLFLALDYDGTLTRIVRHPDQARLDPAVRRTLRLLAARPDCFLALVSGRGLRDLQGKVRVPGLWLVGNHGLQIEGPGHRVLHPAARRAQRAIGRIRTDLERVLAPVPGAWVENKRWTLTVHDREVPAARRAEVRRIVRRLAGPAAREGEVRITAGKRVLEIRPPVRWTKGEAVAWLLKRARAEEAASVLRLYAGDDRTDEDAFRTLGRRNVTVVIGSAAGRSRARYRLRGPADLHRFLKRLLALREHGE